MWTLYVDVQKYTIIINCKFQNKFSNILNMALPEKSILVLLGKNIRVVTFTSDLENKVIVRVGEYYLKFI